MDLIDKTSKIHKVFCNLTKEFLFLFLMDQKNTRPLQGRGKRENKKSILAQTLNFVNNGAILVSNRLPNS